MCLEPSLGAEPQGSARVQISAAACWKRKQKGYIQKDYIPVVSYSLHELLKLELEESV